MTYPVRSGINFVARYDGLVLFIVDTDTNTTRPPDQAYNVNSGVEYGSLTLVPTRSTSINGTAGTYGTINGGTTANPLNVTDGTPDAEYGPTFKLVHDGNL